MDETSQQKSEELIELEREVAAGRASPAEQRRHQRLKRKYERGALGPLARALQRYEFRDGVLHTAVPQDGKRLGDCARDPRWATVEVLDLTSGRFLKGLGMSIADFLVTMPLLHTLSVREDQVPERPCPGVTTLQVDGELEMAVIADRFPDLETLAVGFIRRPEELWSHPFTQQLDSITVGALTWKGDVVVFRPGEGHAFTDWIAKGPPCRRLEIQEEAVFGASNPSDLQEFFDSARLKGADVALLPEPMPRSEWSPWRRRDRYHDRWH